MSVLLASKKLIRMSCLFIVLVFIFGSAGLYAQQVISVSLKTGKDLEGTIESSSTQVLRLRTNQGVLTIRQDQVDHVDENADSARPGRVQWGTDSTRWLKTVFYVKDSKRDLSDKELIRNFPQVLAECRRETTETVGRLDTYVYDRPTTIPPDLLLLCVECWGEAGDVIRTISRLEDLYTSYPEYLKSTDEARMWALGYLRNGMEYSLKNGDVELGGRCLLLLSGLQPNAKQPDVKILWLAGAAAKRQRGDYIGAMDIVINRIAPRDDKLAYTEAVFLLNSADENHIDLDERFKILGLFSTAFVRVPFAKFGLGHFIEYGEQLIQRNEIDRAEEFAKSVEKVDRESGIYLGKLVDLQRRIVELGVQDVQGKYELAGWAKDNGLTVSSVALYNELYSDPHAGQNAKLQVQLIEQENECNAFQVIANAMDSGRFSEVIRLGKRFQSEFPNGEYFEKVSAQLDLAKFRLGQSEKLRPAKAEVLMQNAERAYFEKKFEVAGHLLLEIEADYSDTKAAIRARDLRRRMGLVQPEAVSYVEGAPDLRTQMGTALAARAAYLGELQAAYDQLRTSLKNPVKQ